MCVSHQRCTPFSALTANRVQGFLAAGHVCAVMGYWEYPPLAEQYQVPIVVTGFEPVDMLQGILKTVQMLEEGEVGAENAYARAVTFEGNKPAQSNAQIKSSRNATANGAASARSQ